MARIIFANSNNELSSRVASLLWRFGHVCEFASPDLPISRRLPSLGFDLLAEVVDAGETRSHERTVFLDREQIASLRTGLPAIILDEAECKQLIAASQPLGVQKCDRVPLITEHFLRWRVNARINAAIAKHRAAASEGAPAELTPLVRASRQVDVSEPEAKLKRA